MSFPATLVMVIIHRYRYV